jgi:hypothetical protein
MARRQRKYPQLPLHAEIERVAFGYVLSGKPYLARDIRNAVVSALNVAPENLALLHANTSGLALDNRVARVMQDFTQKGIHTGQMAASTKMPTNCIIRLVTVWSSLVDRPKGAIHYYPYLLRGIRKTGSVRLAPE